MSKLRDQATRRSWSATHIPGVTLRRSFHTHHILQGEGGKGEGREGSRGEGGKQRGEGREGSRREGGEQRGGGGKRGGREAVGREGSRGEGGEQRGWRGGREGGGNGVLLNTKLFQNQDNWLHTFGMSGNVFSCFAPGTAQHLTPLHTAPVP